MYFVPHFGHAKVYETSIWTPCFQISAKTLLWNGVSQSWCQKLRSLASRSMQGHVFSLPCHMNRVLTMQQLQHFLQVILSLFWYVYYKYHNETIGSLVSHHDSETPAYSKLRWLYIYDVIGSLDECSDYFSLATTKGGNNSNQKKRIHKGCTMTKCNRPHKAVALRHSANLHRKKGRG